jgi:hypothetical protein
VKNPRYELRSSLVEEAQVVAKMGRKRATKDKNADEEEVCDQISTNFQKRTVIRGGRKTSVIFKISEEECKAVRENSSKEVEKVTDEDIFPDSDAETSELPAGNYQRLLDNLHLLGYRIRQFRTRVNGNCMTDALADQILRGSNDLPLNETQIELSEGLRDSIRQTLVSDEFLSSELSSKISNEERDEITNPRNYTNNSVPYLEHICLVLLATELKRKVTVITSKVDMNNNPVQYEIVPHTSDAEARASELPNLCIGHLSESHYYSLEKVDDNPGEDVVAHIWTDGGCTPSGGTSCGIVLRLGSETSSITATRSYFLSKPSKGMTNNVAEYSGVINGMALAL